VKLGGSESVSVDMAALMPGGGRVWRAWLPLAAGAAVFALPTFYALATEQWTTEAGAHGPIVLAAGLWLIVRQWPDALRVARPGHLGLTLGLLLPALLLYVFGHVVGVLGIEAFAVLAALLAVLYGLVGMAALRLLWFPLLYLMFLVPPPDTVVAAVTQPLKLAISHVSAELLGWLGYPVVNTGVILQVAQYQLLVATACAGLNSIISVSAIGLLYVYLLHGSNGRYAALLVAAVLPVAIFANFVRILILILITYHFGDAAAQGYLHSSAGILTFAMTVLGLFAVDALLAPVRRRLERGKRQATPPQAPGGRA